jgi:putative addiction module component (TIGR02574 family)
MTAITIKEEVRKLSRAEQLSLIQFIVQIIQEDDDFVLSDALKEELDRRDEAYREGSEKLHTWVEAQEMITRRS